MSSYGGTDSFIRMPSAKTISLLCQFCVSDLKKEENEHISYSVKVGIQFLFLCN